MLRFTLSVWVPQAEKHRGIEPAAQLLGKLGNFALLGKLELILPLLHDLPAILLRENVAVVGRLRSTA